MNIELLKRYISNSTLSMVAIAEEIGMNERTFFRRMKANNFTVNEFLAIAKLLRLTNDQMLKILGR